MMPARSVVPATPLQIQVAPRIPFVLSDEGIFYFDATLQMPAAVTGVHLARAGDICRSNTGDGLVGKCPTGRDIDQDID